MAPVFVLFLLIVGMLTLAPQGTSRFSTLSVPQTRVGCGCSTTITLLLILVGLLILRFG